MLRLNIDFFTGSSKILSRASLVLLSSFSISRKQRSWEYPGYKDHMGTPADTVNYSLFLAEIKNALTQLGTKTGKTYGLTAALPCGGDNIANIQVDVVSKILDELNLMTYDFHGTWNNVTGANAPLYDMEGSPDLSVHSCVELWKAGGGSTDQINIGLPFYGRSFAGEGITKFGQKFDAKADDIAWSEDEGSPQCKFSKNSLFDHFVTLHFTLTEELFCLPPT